jgi:predicted lipid-binding transport protein (Tim44 family)
VNGELLEILILAVIAGVVVARLYSVLGRRTGSEGPTARPAPIPTEARPTSPGPASAPAQTAPLPNVGGIDDVARLDPSFDAAQFVAGAKAAYEMIVSAFAAGDRETLRGLLTPRVYASYDTAISGRDARGEKGPELVRLRAAEIVDAQVNGDMARVAVRFEAELAEGAHGIRETKEKWTFERDVRSRDPNWLLAAVAQA